MLMSPVGLRNEKGSAKKKKKEEKKEKKNEKRTKGKKKRKLQTQLLVREGAPHY
jgi:hypothetical protein